LWALMLSIPFPYIATTEFVCMSHPVSFARISNKAPKAVSEVYSYRPSVDESRRSLSAGLST